MGQRCTDIAIIEFEGEIYRRCDMFGNPLPLIGTSYATPMMARRLQAMANLTEFDCDNVWPRGGPRAATGD